MTRLLLLSPLLLTVACRSGGGKLDSAAPTGDCTWYADADADGYGDLGAPAEGPCGDAPAGFSASDDDCDDTDAAVHPGAEELCNLVDDDCDGQVDDAVEAGTWLADADGDGYGDDDDSSQACEAPEGTVPADQGGDCDDSDPDSWPGAPERCDGADNDCDGQVDEDLTSTWYADSDGDGYGDAESSLESCDPGSGWVDTTGDCDDSDADIHPDAEETCNDQDDDCDGDTDEDLLGTWYPDGDGDGWGAAGSEVQGCEPGEGWVEVGGDCDDANSNIHPDADEACDGIDDDCDGLVDDDDPSVTGGSTWYVDADADGYGDADNTVVACEQPSGAGADSSDCDDSDGSVNPAATELCDGVDDDCDGTVDEDDASDAATWYLDADSDGYGDASSSTMACERPSGYSADSSDCDDHDDDINPGAAEACNSADDDCDGAVDEDVLSTFYDDADGDGFGDAGSGSTGCSPSSGQTADSSDCDDGEAAVNPAASELCNGVDDDCDGTVDESEATDAATWLIDADADGYGSSSYSVTACEQPTGYVSSGSGGDCDDLEATTYPGADEICDGADNDCDGTVDEDEAIDTDTFYGDADGDGWGAASDTVSACSAPSGYVEDAPDCDDSDASIHPEATESCNGVDDDCDGDVDDDDPDVTGTFTWYTDADNDGYGDAESPVHACTRSRGVELDDSDCDDSLAAVNPGATEICNGTDDDCSGAISWLEEDPDGDGARTCGSSLWLRSGSYSNTDPGTSAPYGASQAAALLAGHDMGFDTATMADTEITAELLDSYGLLVLFGVGDHGPLSADESLALYGWLSDGGSLLYLGYHPYSSTCAMVDSLPASFGLSCADYDDHWTGLSTSVTAHEVTTDISYLSGTGGEHWTVSSPAQTVVEIDGWPVVAVLEQDDGRMVAVSDEWPYYDSGSGDSDITAVDNWQLVENSWAWLTDLPL